MFTEFLKIKPQIDRAALSRMVADLSSRFAKVAKSFGGGLKTALKAAPFLAVAGAFAAKLLNPLEKAQGILEKLLGEGDDAVTFAEEFGTDPGKLLQLQAVAATKGLDTDTLRQLMLKFQGALAEEQERAKDPTQAAGTLREFVDETDTADAFFKFIKSLQAIDKSRAVVVQQEVFGEKVRGKASEFVNAKDLDQIFSQLPSAKAFREAAERSGALSDRNDLLKSIRNSQDFVTKAGLATDNMVDQIDKSERQALVAEQEQIRKFESLAETSIAIGELTNKFDKFTTELMTNAMPVLVEGVGKLSQFASFIQPIISEYTPVLVAGVQKVGDGITALGFKLQDLWGQMKESALFKYAGKFFK